MKYDGRKFYISENDIINVINSLNNCKSDIDSVKKLINSDFIYKTDVTNICDEIESVKLSLDNLKSFVNLAKERIISISDSFFVDYNRQKIYFESQKNDVLYIDNEENITLTNEQLVQSLINFINDIDSDKRDAVKKEVERHILEDSKLRDIYLSTKLEDVGKWYLENVPTYWGAGYQTRQYYDTPFSKRDIGDDCTEFTNAYMSYICGENLSETSSYGMIDPNGTWAKEAEKYGWKAYCSDKITELKPGDVVVADNRYLYREGGKIIKSTKGQHAEVYLNEKESFGWGKVQSEYPLKRAITKVDKYGVTHYEDEKHDYVTVYRYEGKE